MSEVALQTEFDFSEEEIALLLDNIDDYTFDEVVEIDKMVNELANRKANQLAFDDLNRILSSHDAGIHCW